MRLLVPVLTTIRRTKQLMQWSRKRTFQICIVIILICLTIHTNWIFFHQQMSSIMQTNYSFEYNNNINDDTKEDKKNNQNDNIIWEWKRYSIDSTNNRTAPMNENDDNKKRILIAQYDAGRNGNSSKGSNNNSTYDIILNITSHMNQLYAYQYQVDYVLVRGIVYHTLFETHMSLQKSTKSIQVQSSRSTYNKVYIIEKAIQLQQYDYLLLLDSDAMIYDFNRTISQLVLLIPYNKMIVAHQVSNSNHKDSENNKNQNTYKKQYNINIGVTIWNIHHPMIHTIVTLWKFFCYYRIIFQLHDNDQKPLQTLLRYYHSISNLLSFVGTRSKSTTSSNIIEENYIDFAYRHGTFIKHFIRHHSNVWSSQSQSQSQQQQIDDDNTNRIKEIAIVATEICIRYNLLMCNNYSSYIL